LLAAVQTATDGSDQNGRFVAAKFHRPVAFASTANQGFRIGSLPDFIVALRAGPSFRLCTGAPLEGKRLRMMRKLLVIVGLVLLAGSIVMAQEVPTSEAYMGYSFIRVNTGTQVNAFNSNGGLGSFQLNFNKNFGIVAEFGGNTKEGVSIAGPDRPLEQTQFTYLFGLAHACSSTGRGGTLHFSNSCLAEFTTREVSPFRTPH
jgi:hypothetical protein